jgi:hypothetical protein
MKGKRKPDDDYLILYYFGERLELARIYHSRRTAELQLRNSPSNVAASVYKTVLIRASELINWDQSAISELEDLYRL